MAPVGPEPAAPSRRGCRGQMKQLGQTPRTSTKEAGLPKCIDTGLVPAVRAIQHRQHRAVRTSALPRMTPLETVAIAWRAVSAGEGRHRESPHAFIAARAAALLFASPWSSRFVQPVAAASSAPPKAKSANSRLALQVGFQLARYSPTVDSYPCTSLSAWSRAREVSARGHRSCRVHTSQSEPRREERMPARSSHAPSRSRSVWQYRVRRVLAIAAFGESPDFMSRTVMPAPTRARTAI